MYFRLYHGFTILAYNFTISSFLLMNKLLATALLLFISLCLVAQNTKITFGEVPIEDISSKIYPDDSTAEAVVLYDFGETSFDYRNQKFYITLKYHGRIKILKKSALDRATISIPFYKGSKGAQEEYITQVKGFTHNLEDGKIVKEKLAKEMIFNEKLSDEYHQLKFSLPKVKEGSVIEYSYEISTPMTINTSPKTWTFQSSLPVKWSEYRITIPNVLFYRMIMSGYLSLDINDFKNTNTMFAGSSMNAISYQFVVKNAPAFRNESHITTPSDYLSKIDFELASINWPEVITKNFSLDYNNLTQTLLSDENFGEIYKKTSIVKDIAKQIQAENKDTLEQWKAAKNYLVKNIKWNEENGIYASNLKKVLEKKEGSSSEINFLYLCILRELGYDAHPLILSTRAHGRINPTYALLKKFNYVVVHLSHNGKDVLLDATDEYLPPHILPVSCLTDDGWLVHPTQARFISIVPNDTDREFEKADLTISEEGELTGTFSKSYGGYSGASAKNAFKEIGKDKFLEEIKKGKPAWTITKAEFKNTEAIEQVMEANYELSMTEFANVAGPMIYLKPMLSEGHTQNPFKESERIYPVDFEAPIEETFLANYTLPAGFQAVELPKPAAVALPEGGGRFVYTVSQSGNKITIISRLNIRKKSFMSLEYGTLKAFFDQLIAKHNEQIVLKKGN